MKCNICTKNKNFEIFIELAKQTNRKPNTSGNLMTLFQHCCHTVFKIWVFYFLLLCKKATKAILNRKKDCVKTSIIKTYSINLDPKNHSDKGCVLNKQVTK